MNGRFTLEDTTLIKGFAILMMLYHHLFAFENRIPAGAHIFAPFTVQGQPIAYWIAMIGGLCVQIFMLLSGYGICKSISGSAVSLRKYLFSRLGKIYSTYWTVFMVFIPICFFCGALPVKPNILINFAIMISNFLGVAISYNGEWWFFTTYIMLLLSAPVICKLQRKLKLSWKLFIIALLQFAVLITPEAVEKWFSQNIIRYNLWGYFSLLPVFLSGWFLAEYDLLGISKRIKLPSLVKCSGSIFGLLSISVVR